MATHYIKEGDTSPAIEYALTPVTVLLTGASVVFSMRDRRGTVKVNQQAATITDNGTGDANGTPTVQYDWTASDTDTAGTYYGEFEVTYADTSVETFPNSENITILITKDVA